MGAILNHRSIWSRLLAVSCHAIKLLHAKFRPDWAINVTSRASGPKIGRDLCMGAISNNGLILSRFFTVSYILP